MTQLGVFARPSWVNAQRRSRWIWDLRRARRDPAGSSLNALDPLVLTIVRGGGPTSGHHRGGVGELADIGQAWRGPRWCLMGVVGVEVRVRVTAPAKFDSGRRGHHWPGLHRQLVLASARQSAAVDLSRLPDEFVGLPTGFLVSGVATFVGTLWPTGDVPAALMTMRIIELMFPRDPSAKAQPRPGRSSRRGPGCVT